MKTLNWIEQDLCRRDLVGALLHVNKELRTDGFRKQAIIDVTNIFINRLNELASVYELESGEHIGIDATASEYLDDQKEVDKLLDDALGPIDDTDDVAECKLCRRECPIEPSSGLCESCDHQGENQKAAAMYFAMRDENG